MRLAVDPGEPMKAAPRVVRAVAQIDRMTRMSHPTSSAPTDYCRRTLSGEAPVSFRVAMSAHPVVAVIAPTHDEVVAKLDHADYRHGGD